MIQRYISLTVTICFLLTGLGACERNDGDSLEKTIKLSDPDRFAQYINKLSALPSGDYTIVAATSTAGESGAFTLTVARDDGSVENFNGNWDSSGGMDPASANNPQYPVTIHAAGGINIELKSSVDTYLYLLSANGVVFSENDDISTSDTNSQILLESSRIDSEAYGAAYYAAIDPGNLKDTLAKWKQMNGFDDAFASDRIVEPRFRDTKDLGYGRGMRMWTKPDGSLYFFVENFQVRTIPGLEYTSTNLDALLLNDRKHHFGTNAIEYSTYPYGPGEPCGFDSTDPCAITDPHPPRFAKFYTFDASKANQAAEDHAHETRLNRVNLDGRGLKAMPNACVYCHGGTLRPLRADGSFRDNTLNGTAGNGINGDTNAKLQLLEVPSFEFWEDANGSLAQYTKSNQEPVIKQVNQAVYCTYPNLPAAAIPIACAQFCLDPADTVDCDGNGNSIEAVLMCKDPANTADCDGKGNDLTTVFTNIDLNLFPAGRWTGAFAREMAEGWYDDPAQAGLFDRNTFNADFVPVAWRPDSATGNPPAGSDKLFLDVVQPICFVCHSRRGTTLGSDLAVNGSKDIDFSSYNKFIGHAEQIKTYVFDYGVMPLSLRGYNTFWGGDAPITLASHINGKLPPDKQVVINDVGSIDEPGAPIADAGPDISALSPVRTFGSNSRFVDTYSWSIVSVPAGGEAAILSDADQPRALLTAPVDGDYVLRLVASNKGKSDQDTVIIKINSGLSVAPKALTFVDNIKPVFNEIAEIANGGDGKRCNECHQQFGGAGAIDGIPMWWTDDPAQPSTGGTLYQEVLARIDFNDPENSLLLKKPSGNHHYGGLRGNGFDRGNPSNRYNYDTFLNWIIEGARYDSTTMREP
jgi:hypothetical protein